MLGLAWQLATLIVVDGKDKIVGSPLANAHPTPQLTPPHVVGSFDHLLWHSSSGLSSEGNARLFVFILFHAFPGAGAVAGAGGRP